jgi:hypothetical protein
MLRLLLAFLLAWPVLAANIRLHLTDGTHHVVREYEVKADRVRFYSVERSEWEEIPLDLVDLKKTKAEQAEREADRKAEVAAIDAEDQAERAMVREISRIPVEAGVYWINGEELTPLKQAESKVNTNKRRSILTRISPVPVFAGKATLEVDGETAAMVVGQDRPEFYFRLVNEERFGIVKVTPQKGVRIVEKWSIIPVTKELVQEQETVEIFRHQVGDGLYKIWPQKPLEPGQYAVVEYTEGKGNTQIWDFAYYPAGSAPAPAPPPAPAAKAKPAKKK